MVTSPLDRMVRKLRTRSNIDDRAAALIGKLPYVQRQYDPSAYLVREGQIDLSRCMFVEDGFAFRQKLTIAGARQIVSLHVAGDFLDLQQLFLNRSDHNVQALTRLTTIEIDRQALRTLALSEPSIGRALWTDALVEGSIYREWVTNVGRRDAKGRVAHLLCEMAVRMEIAGLGDGKSCELPMTQEQIGDAVGLTSVHVNRTLKALAQDGVIERGGRHVAFKDWERIRAVADFSALYLHADQVSSDRGI